MTRNENKLLERCIYSIIETITVDYEIYIIDNNSTDRLHLKILDELSLINNVNVIKNKKNSWILGLNKTIEEVRNKHKSKYFFLTDGDIDFSQCQAKPCWLSYLVNKMEINCSIGKIGLSLSWSLLESNNDLSNILEQEKNLYSNKKIDDLFVAAVDTTATLFRFDWSVEGSSSLYPDHMRYLRPELYSCRTSRDIIVEHMGWETYKIGVLNRNDIDSKIKCFTFIGGFIKEEILSQASIKIKYLYKILHKPVLYFWMLRRYYFLFKYVIHYGRRGFFGQGSGK